MTDVSTDTRGSVDGRRLRRQRGRQAVIDAMIDLVLEGHAPPSAVQVAERAGVSQASLFRYFESLEELRHEAIDRYRQRFDHLLAIPDLGQGPLTERIERFVAARDTFYDHTAPMARLARRQSGQVTELAETVDGLRAEFAEQIAEHFAPELDGDEHRVAVVAALTSFEAWEQLATLGVRNRRIALSAAVADLLDR